MVLRLPSLRSGLPLAKFSIDSLNKTLAVHINMRVPVDSRLRSRRTKFVQWTMNMYRLLWAMMNKLADYTDEHQLN